jgi:hypothetical protein
VFIAESAASTSATASWRQGATLDVAEWMTSKDGCTPVVVLSVAHLDDDERALVMFDEVYGFLPPRPANPPTKRPIGALMKRARAFGVGIVVATQNPMDLDCRALGNAGVWCVGRLQTDADRARVVDGLATSGDRESAQMLGKLVQRIAPRWFVLRDVHAGEPVLMQPRYAMSMLRGPLTRSELVAARSGR